MRVSPDAWGRSGLGANDGGSGGDCVTSPRNHGLILYGRPFETAASRADQESRRSWRAVARCVVASPGARSGAAAGRGAYAIQVVESCAPRQDFALNLIKRRLCCGVGACIERTVEDCTAYRCAATAARSRAAATTNMACSTFAFALASRALFGGAKSCALVNLFMICHPDGRLVASRRPNSAPDHGDLMTKKGPAFRLRGQGPEPS